jgi:dihydrofolate reductase
MTLSFNRRFPAIFLLVCMFLACRVTLVPEYSAQLEDQIAKTAKATDKLYIDMLDVPLNNRTYESFKDRYNEIESEINSIRLKNEARPKNADFLVINKNLKEAFEEAKKYHKENSTLADGEAKAYQATLAGFWRPLYLAEIALKPAKR